MDSLLEELKTIEGILILVFIVKNTEKINPEKYI